ncbi:unnamed protein product, partial [Rotaria sp. Silwood2]
KGDSNDGFNGNQGNNDCDREEWNDKRFKYNIILMNNTNCHQKRKQLIRKYLQISINLYDKCYLNNVSVNIDNQQAFTRFLDAGMTYSFYAHQ